MSGVVQGFSLKKMMLVGFQDGCKNNLTSNQLTIVIGDESPVEKEPKVTMIPEIPEDKVTSEKGYYHGIYVIIYFCKELGSDMKEEQAYVNI